MSKNNFEQHTWIKNIEDIMSDSFGKYAKYIIQDRALPDVRDGLKPVQRRILFAMNELGLSYDKPHKKSARTVGEVIGKYHPHGDTSIYDAMVRMSQSWKSNAPQLDMHGNNGSIDGDFAAAMRYTEARLSRFGQAMLDNIFKNTVPFIFNFDDSEKEPSVLPTLLPNLLVNGVSGIAAGYATNIPPFNFNEVVDAIITRIDSPNCRLESILKVMPGPDFPTSGIILNKSGIIEAYETGRGKITIRAKMEYNKQNKQVIISEIPFETSKSEIVKKIDELRLKHDVLQINEVRDESDINGISIVLDVKNDKNYDLLKNFLYKNTQLQISYNINAVAIKDRKPYLMPMLMILDAFIEHANNIIIKSSKFDLDKAIERQEILNGLIKAIKLLDDVIETIKKSDGKQSAKQGLMNKFAFSEKQAEAIVNLRLYRLSSGDINELNNELKNLEIQISELNGLLSNDSLRSNYLKAKLRDFKKIFGQERKSLITDEDDKIVIDQSDIIEDKNQIILVTRDGYLKSITNKGFVANEYSDLKLKDGDIPVSQFISNQRDKVVLITNKGNYIVIPTFKIPNTKWKEMGVHYNNIVVGNEQEKIIFAFNFANNVSDNRKLLLATRNGLIKQTLVSALNIGKNAKLSNCISLDENDELVSAQTVNNDFTGNICLITKFGIGLRYSIEQISLVGKNAAGVKSIGLKNNDSVVNAFIDNISKEMIAVFTKNGGKRIKKDLIALGSRGNVGKTIVSQIKSNPIEIISAFEINSNEMINVVDNNNKWTIIKAVDVPIGSNETRISAVKNIKFNLVNKNYLVDNAIIEETNDEDKQDSLFKTNE